MDIPVNIRPKSQKEEEEPPRKKSVCTSRAKARLFPLENFKVSNFSRVTHLTCFWGMKMSYDELKQK